MSQPSAPSYLSFNSKISPGLASFQSPSHAELEDMKTKDPALGYTWTIWEQVMPPADQKAAHYSDNTKRVAPFSTVKEFWKYWNHLPQPSELLDGKRFVRESGNQQCLVDALMVFRDGIKPEWEDPMNASGGHFQFQLKPQLQGGIIDEYWNNIILGMIGGTIEPAKMITGLRLVDKTQQKLPAIRIEVWFSNWDDTEKVDQLQRNLEKCMTTKLDGTQSPAGNWGRSDRKTHAPTKKP